jgi:hypothetical protein
MTTFEKLKSNMDSLKHLFKNTTTDEQQEFNTKFGTIQNRFIELEKADKIVKQNATMLLKHNEMINSTSKDIEDMIETLNNKNRQVFDKYASDMKSIISSYDGGGRRIKKRSRRHKKKRGKKTRGKKTRKL